MDFGMIPIELTQDHKDKLLKMAKKLFPKYVYITFSEGTCDLCNYTGNILLHKSTRWNDWSQVHWFEFCLFHLNRRIQQKLDIYTPENGFMTADTGEEAWFDYQAELINDWLYYQHTNGRFGLHPVDYLYEQFQKID
jgi:hypothetical protein